MSIFITITLNCLSGTLCVCFINSICDFVLCFHLRHIPMSSHFVSACLFLNIKYVNSISWSWSSVKVKKGFWWSVLRFYLVTRTRHSRATPCVGCICLFFFGWATTAACSLVSKVVSQLNHLQWIATTGLIAEGELMVRICSLCKWMRGLAASTMGMLVLEISSPPQGSNCFGESSPGWGYLLAVVGW